MLGFVHIRKGDTVTRLLGGELQMYLKVLKVDDSLIYCGPPHMSDPPEGMTWTFDRFSGAEIDHDLGWGPQYGHTGSYLIQLEI